MAKLSELSHRDAPCEEGFVEMVRPWRRTLRDQAEMRPPFNVEVILDEAADADVRVERVNRKNRSPHLHSCYNRGAEPLKIDVYEVLTLLF